ncbi:MAG: MATE family efflux transporter [Gemmatimonadetes bacterium]|nr:MATE family efflux transporter [Gemmatimonadota bacterium]
MSGGALRVPTRRELLDVARLAGPIVLVQLGLMSMGTVDAIMLGRVSPTAMAGGALGNWHWLLVTMVGQGAIQAIDPIVSQARGAGDAAAVRLGVQRGLLLGLVLTVPTMLLLWPAERVMHRLGQPADVALLAGQYSTALIPGVLAYYWFFALRQSLQALHAVRPVLVTVLIANLINALLNWVLIFGRLGAPALGVQGAALATTIGRWTTVILLLGIAWPQLATHLQSPWREARQWPALWSMLRLGLPIGIHQWLEIAAFGAALLLMGLFGTVPLAAHNLTIQVAALTYMVPLGTSAAAAVLVGHAIGRRDMDAARREASAALACGVGFMATCAGLIMAFPGPLAAVFTRDPGVLALAARLLPIAAAFQVFDGIQGVSSGILRGAGDTRVPMLLNLFGFVAVGIPAAAWLAFSRGLGPEGIWWGLVICLAVVATSLGWRVHTRLGASVARVER